MAQKKKKRRSGQRRHRTVPLLWQNVGLAVLAVVVLAFAVYAVNGQGASSASSGVLPSSPSPTAVATARPLGIIGLGDSVTEGNAVDGTKPGVSWFGQMVTADKRLRFIFNAGDFGNTTGAMLARLQRDVLARKPQVVTVMGGTNDIIQGVARRVTIDNLTTIIDRLTAAKIRVALATIPPTNNRALLARTASLNQAIRTLAAEKKIVLLDLHDAVADPDGTYKTGLTDDGRHPNYKGHLLMAQVAQTAMAAAGL